MRPLCRSCRAFEKRGSSDAYYFLHFERGYGLGNRRAEETIRSIDPATLAEPRAVGRKRLPTTVIGLITHIAEHTQRHLGQAISAAKLARAG
jgi:hypothetical protein